MLDRKSFIEQGIKNIHKEWLGRSNPMYKVIRRTVSDRLVEFVPEDFVVKKDLYELHKRLVMVMQDEDVIILE